MLGMESDLAIITATRPAVGSRSRWRVGKPQSAVIGSHQQGFVAAQARWTSADPVALVRCATASYAIEAEARHKHINSGLDQAQQRIERSKRELAATQAPSRRRTIIWMPWRANNPSATPNHPSSRITKPTSAIRWGRGSNVNVKNTPAPSSSTTGPTPAPATTDPIEATK